MVSHIDTYDEPMSTRSLSNPAPLSTLGSAGVRKIPEAPPSRDRVSLSPEGRRISAIASTRTDTPLEVKAKTHDSFPAPAGRNPVREEYLPVSPRTAAPSPPRYSELSRDEAGPMEGRVIDITV